MEWWSDSRAREKQNCILFLERLAQPNKNNRLLHKNRKFFECERVCIQPHVTRLSIYMREYVIVYVGSRSALCLQYKNTHLIFHFEFETKVNFES